MKNALSLTISLKHNIGKAIEKYPFLKTTKLCGKGHGPSSEASVILDSWNMLVKKVPIFIPEKFIKDILDGVEMVFSQEQGNNYPNIDAKKQTIYSGKQTCLRHLP